MQKLSNAEAELKKALLIRKSVCNYYCHLSSNRQAFVEAPSLHGMLNSNNNNNNQNRYFLSTLSS